MRIALVCSNDTHVHTLAPVAERLIELGASRNARPARRVLPAARRRRRRPHRPARRRPVPETSATGGVLPASCAARMAGRAGGPPAGSRPARPPGSRARGGRQRRWADREARPRRGGAARVTQRTRAGRAPVRGHLRAPGIGAAAFGVAKRTLSPCCDPPAWRTSQRSRMERVVGPHLRRRRTQRRAAALPRTRHEPGPRDGSAAVRPAGAAAAKKRNLPGSRGSPSSPRPSAMPGWGSARSTRNVKRWLGCANSFQPAASSAPSSRTRARPPPPATRPRFWHARSWRLSEPRRARRGRDPRLPRDRPRPPCPRRPFHAAPARPAALSPLRPAGRSGAAVGTARASGRGRR